MRQIVIHLSSPTYTILSLYNLFSTLHSLFSSRFYSRTLSLRGFPIRLSTPHAHRLPSPAHSVFSCAVEGLYPHAPRVGMLACYRCAVHSSCTLCLLLCCRSVDSHRSVPTSERQCDRAYRTPFSCF